MPSALPDGEPAPADGALPASALAVSAGVRSGSTSTCRTARCAAATAISTPTCRAKSAAGETRRAGSTRRSPRSPRPRRVLGPAAPAARHRLLRWRHPDADGALGAGLDRGRGSRGVRAARGRRGDHRGQPGECERGEPEGAARRRHQPDLVRDAERCPARAGRPRPAAHPWTRHRGGRLGPRRGLRADQRRPHLRRSGRERRRLDRERRGRHRSRARTTSARTRSSSRKGRDWLARCAAGRSRRPTTTCWPAATRSPTSFFPRPASAGMRSATGRVRARNAGTTWATGVTAAGGERDPGRTASSAIASPACAGGTSRQPAAYAARLASGQSPAAARELLGRRRAPFRAADARGAAALRPRRRRPRRPDPPRRRANSPGKGCSHGCTVASSSPARAACSPTSSSAASPPDH